MAVISKLPPEGEAATCKQIIHPYSDHCLIGICDMIYATITGSLRFFTIIQGVQLLLRLRQNKGRLDYNLVKSWIRGYGHSIALGVSMGTIFTATQCLLRRLLGRYTFYSVSFIPALLGGIGIFLELKSRRKVVINSYASMAMEVFEKKLERADVYKFTKENQTHIFMVINALLMFTMANFTKPDSHFFWFYKPDPKLTVQMGKEAVNMMARMFFKYSLTGLALQCFRMLVAKPFLLKDPKALKKELFQNKTLSLAKFLGSYVLGYQLIEKIFYIARGHSAMCDSLIAGFCAGYAYKFTSDISILNTCFVTLFEVFTTIATDKKWLPNLPYGEISMCLWNAILYHARAVDQETCPRLMFQIMTTVTSGRSDYIFDNYLNIINANKPE